MDPAADENLAAIIRSPSYLLAENDTEFLKRPGLRPLRLQLELLKPEMIQVEHDITSTIVVFGGTRIVETREAEDRLAAARRALQDAPHDPALVQRVQIAERVLAKAHYYDQARELGRIVSSACQVHGRCDFVIVTGGGPGIMEAANRGAFDIGAKSIGYNVTLPMEQRPNAYITPSLCFQFHYFAIRKMHFLLRAKALVAFPGGFGTLDELFETLTLIQTKKIKPLPVLLYGREFWERVVDFELLADAGMISPEDTKLFHYVETPEQAWGLIRDFYELDGGQRQD